MTNHNDLKQRWLVGQIDRRTFLKLSVAAGATAAAATLWLPGMAHAEEPNKGGRLRLGLGGGSTTDSLDPANYTDAFMQHMGFGFRNNLTEVAADGSLAPELAAEWEPSEGGAVWTFKLREGVEFHDGKSLDADDVVASINHHRGEDSKSAAKSILESIQDIKSDGPQLVVVTLAEASADFPFLMSDYHLGIMPAKDGKADVLSGIGTGAYVIQNYDPGVSAFLTRNPSYFKSDRAHFDEVEFIGIADPAARQNAVITGAVDVANRLDLKTVHLLSRAPGVTVIETPGNQHYTFAMITTNAPFDNNDVRLALKYAIDREKLLQAILRGHGVVGNDHPIGPEQPMHADGLEQRQYDPEKAKYHLKQAGMDTLKVNLSAADSAFGGAVDAAVLFQEAAKAAGIDINVVREPNDGYWSNVWMKKPFCAVYWGGRPTADWMFTTAYARGAAWNDTFWDNERFNELLIAGRGELDEAKRTGIYAEMQQICSDDGGTIIPMFANFVDARSEKVATPEAIASNMELDGQRAMERWWFA
jgi:peptide/nickel transport system substrate-binding protein